MMPEHLTIKALRKLRCEVKIPKNLTIKALRKLRGVGIDV
jgi:hypothetical protein